MEKIRTGVIGYGATCEMGRMHLKSMEKAGMEPTAVVEPNPERLECAAKDFPGIETYSSVKEMLGKSKVKLLVVITPHNTHRDIAMECLRAGRHVISEKPLCITTEECDEIISEAKKRGLLLTAFHNRHWDGGILEAMRLIKEEKMIGDIVHIEAHCGQRAKEACPIWRGSKSISGGILYDWGVHLLEYGLQLLGDAKLVEVTGFAANGFWSATSKWGADTCEDEAHLVARFDNGAWMSLNVTAIDTLPKSVDRNMLEITATKGTCLMGIGSVKVIRPLGEGRTEILEKNNLPNQWDNFYDNIAAHLYEGAKLVITPEWSRRPIHILDLAVKSAVQGQCIPAKHH